MKFSEFCDTIENTEKEQQLLQYLNKAELQDAKKVFVKMTRTPVMGKVFEALLALENYDSIEGFKQSEHYSNIKDYEFSVDFESNSLNIGVSEVQKKKMTKCVVIAAIVIVLLIIFRKLRKRRKNAS